MRPFPWIVTLNQNETAVMEKKNRLILSAKYSAWKEIKPISPVQKVLSARPKKAKVKTIKVNRTFSFSMEVKPEVVSTPFAICELAQALREPAVLFESVVGPIGQIDFASPLNSLDHRVTDETIWRSKMVSKRQQITLCLSAVWFFSD